MQVPFDQLGNLIRHPHRYPHPEEIVWGGADPFEAYLRLHNVRAAQGYGKYVLWQEVHGHRVFPMDSERAFAVVKNTVMDHGTVLADRPPTWEFTKAHARGGDAYGIKLVRKRFLDQEGGADQDPEGE
ncbi:hypothetical protein SAMN05421874_12866 [Nonomuraea maritima]|uniref:Uncharacterized protein n=1 Tax=Nonomuraea maritima TaxID=683260 RepID=A0A1G9MK09_9ACTN|nr:hypothetical protein [Nonomuraea maritima]SDL74413.1 hypothetical protein SAMN05421874_12866 [Nonomuraea maritima]